MFNINNKKRSSEKSAVFSMFNFSLFLLTALIIPNFTIAQLKKKQIALDSGFLSGAERMEVKLGSIAGGKMWNYRFGNYRLTANKINAKPTREASNFFGTKSEFSSRAKFWFELSDDQQHSAKVEGSIQNDITLQHQLQISEHVFLGQEKLTNTRRNLLAVLNTNDDTTSWRIIAIERSDSSWVGLFTNGTRKIDIIRIYHYEDGKSAAFGISSGCELKENGIIIGAVQYFGNRYNNNVVWLPNSMDPKEKCLVAAALTALMAGAHIAQESLENAL